MPATLEEILRRSQLDFGDALNKDIVNASIRKVVGYVEPNTAWDTTVSVAGQQCYYVSVGSPVKDVVYGAGDLNKAYLTRTSEGELTALGVDFTDATETANSGTPAYWWGVHGGVTADPPANAKYGFALYPIPSSSGVTIRYLLNPAETALASAADICQLPDSCIDAVIAGCEYERAKKVQVEKSQLLYQAYMVELKRARLEMTKQKGTKVVLGDQRF